MSEDVPAEWWVLSAIAGFTPLVFVGGVILAQELGKGGSSPSEKASDSQTEMNVDMVLTIVWALQDIAIIRQMETLKPYDKAVKQVDEYLHLLYDHLILEDMPKLGVRREDIESLSSLVKKAIEAWKKYKEVGVLDQEEFDREFDGNLAGADGYLFALLEKYGLT